jgi:hypothetical protein
VQRADFFGFWKVAVMENDVLSSEAETSTGELLGEIVRLLESIVTAGGLSPHDLSRHFVSTADTTELVSRHQKVVSLGARQRECMEVMCRWRRDPAFLGPDALPVPLPQSDGPTSFPELCRRAGVRTATESVIATLVEFGAIEVDSEGKLFPRTPTFLLSPSTANSAVALDGVLKQVAGFLKVIEHNLVSVRSGGRRRFERTCTVRVARELVPVFERIVSERGQEFIDAIDEWLERKRVSDSQYEQATEIGVGAYFVDLGCARSE